MNSHGIPGGAADLSQPRGIAVTDWRIVPAAGFKIEPGKVLNMNGDYIVTFIDLGAATAHVIPYSADALRKLGNDIHNALHDGANAPESQG